MLRYAKRAGVGWLCPLLLSVGSVAGVAVAQVPPLLSFQGKLVDATGVPVADATYAMEFRFYDACSGGNLLLTDAHAAVQTRDGIYSVLLGSGSVLPGVEPDLLSAFANHDLLCLGVQVETDSEMVPRQQLVSSGFAMRAAVADGASSVGAMVETGDDVSWTGEHTFEQQVTLSQDSSFYWPQVSGSPPPDAGFRLTKFEASPAGQELHPNGEQDEQWMICYNCQPGSTERRDLTQHGWNQKIEATYWDGIRESVEYNWNYTGPVGNKWRPFAFRLIVDGQCSHDLSVCTDDSECGVGNTCDGANMAEFQWNHRLNQNGVSDLELLRGNGMVRFGRGLQGVLDYSGDDGSMSSLVGFDLAAAVNTIETSSGPVVFGAVLATDFSSPTTDAQLTDVFALRATNTFSGATAGRDVTSQLIAVDAQNLLTQTGDGAPTANRVVGLRYRFQPTGNHVAVNESNGLRIDTPGALQLTDPVTIERHFAIRILDQGGLGGVDGGALVVNAQSTNPDPSRGNVTMKGGGWDDGHIVLANGHLWFDKSADLPRFSDGPPASESDGTPLHTPPGTNTNWGVALWGDGTSATHDTGDEVCQLAGLTCEETYDMGSSTPVACGVTSHAGKFTVLCR